MVALTVPVMTMGPAWAGRGWLRCHRNRSRAVCYRAVACCPVVNHSTEWEVLPEIDCTVCEPVTCCEVSVAEIADAPMTMVDEVGPRIEEIPADSKSVVAQPTRPDTSAVAETVPSLAPAAPVAPASVETPVPPAAAPELEAELAELKSELVELKSGMKTDLEAGLSRLKSEMKMEMSELKSDLKSDLTDLKTGMKTDLEAGLSELKAQPIPEPQPAASRPSSRPAEDNIFEEDKGGSSRETATTEEEARNPAMKEPSEPEISSDAETPPSPPTAKPADSDSPFPLPEIPPPTLEEPVVPDPATPAPTEDRSDSDTEATSDDSPFSAIAPEPVRRWFDDSGSYDAVGQLVEVHPDRVRILKLNGRFTTVPISRLSAADQSYVTATGERLAAKPRLIDTAGM